MVVAQKKGDEFNRDELWDLYKLAIDDRNFQVTINWDRTKHYFIFNFAALSVAAALTGKPLTVLPLVLLGIVVLNSFFAAHSIRKGHEYYRASRARLKTIERQLGLIGEDPSQSPLALNTTRGMKRETKGEMKRPMRDALTITNLAIGLQILMGLAAGYVLVRALLP